MGAVGWPAQELDRPNPWRPARRPDQDGASWYCRGTGRPDGSTWNGNERWDPGLRGVPARRRGERPVRRRADLDGRRRAELAEPAPELQLKAAGARIRCCSKWWRGGAVVRRRGKHGAAVGEEGARIWRSLAGGARERGQRHAAGGAQEAGLVKGESLPGGGGGTGPFSARFPGRRRLVGGVLRRVRDRGR